MKFIIDGSMPGMNEMIDEAKRKNKRYDPYSKMKKEYTNLVHWTCKSQLPRDYKVEKCFLDIAYYCKDKRRDKDNIAACKKFIFDGMQSAGVIKNDGWREVEGWNENFYVDKKNPRIVIIIEEIK